jgi:AcrR family transcriptional regulator
MNRTGWVVRSMSLYRYVRDGDELLDAVVERS